METGTAIGSLVGVPAGVGMAVGALSMIGVGNAFSREMLQYAGGDQNLQLHLRVDGAEGAPWVPLACAMLTDLRVWDAVPAAPTGRFRV